MVSHRGSRDTSQREFTSALQFESWEAVQCTLKQSQHFARTPKSLPFLFDILSADEQTSAELMPAPHLAQEGIV